MGKPLGRPKLSDEQRRDYRLEVRLTDFERRVLELVADGDGRSVSRWVREILFAVIKKNLPQSLKEARRRTKRSSSEQNASP